MSNNVGSSIGGGLHERNEDRVHSCEEDISAPFYIRNHDRRNRDDEEVDALIDDIGEGGALGSDGEGVDLSGVEPGHGEVASEEGDVEEETECGAVGCSHCPGDETAKDDDHGDHLACTAD